MSEKVVIIGASGHGKVIADIIVKSGDIVVGFLDDNLNLGNEFIGFPILGQVCEAQEWKDYKFIVAIGNADIRERMVNELDVGWYTAIHPTAVISSIGVEIGEGTVIMANSVINADAKIGKHCILNTGAIVEHDNVIEDYVHVSVGSKLAGNVSIGRKTWMGIGSQVIQGKTICAEVIIGAGAVVIENISKKGTYVGVPAKECMMKVNEQVKNSRGGVNHRDKKHYELSGVDYVCTERGAA